MGNGPVPQQEEFGSGEPTLADVYRLYEERFKKMDSYFDRWNRKPDEISDEMRVMDQHVTSLEHGARQPRLARAADGPANTKTSERTEGAAPTVQAMHGDSCTAQKVQGGSKTSISFGVKAEPPDLPCREDVLVEDGAARPSRISHPWRCAQQQPPVAYKTSTATEITFNGPLLRFYATEETNSKKKKSWTSVLSHWYDSSFWKLLAAPSCRKVVETKSGENMIFDPGGSQGRLRACPVLGSWRALLCGEVIRAGAVG